MLAVAGATRKQRGNEMRRIKVVCVEHGETIHHHYSDLGEYCQALSETILGYGYVFARSHHWA